MRAEELTGGTLEHWTPEETRAAAERGEIVLIDVRTVPEYAFERIPGALLAPMAEFDPGSMPAAGGKTLVLHCGSGIRSRRVAEMMVAAGHAKIAHVEGGFGAWKSAGLPYIATDPATGGAKRMPPA